MTRHKTVELLHFPPDYVLERDQDYPSAHTTLRWASLLVENGAAAADTAAFKNIVDIAPIAAPSDAGQRLDGIYDKFDPYIKALLALWLPRADGSIRPMVAFGGPVRGWIKQNYAIDLKVLDCAVVQFTANIKAPILAANHTELHLIISSNVSRMTQRHLLMNGWLQLCGLCSRDFE